MKSYLFRNLWCLWLIYNILGLETFLNLIHKYFCYHLFKLKRRIFQYKVNYYQHTMQLQNISVVKNMITFKLCLWVLVRHLLQIFNIKADTYLFDECVCRYNRRRLKSLFDLWIIRALNPLESFVLSSCFLNWKQSVMDWEFAKKSEVRQNYC